MLCYFCSSIDLDQLSREGYKHHASVGDLLGSARNGCDSCSLILDGQWDSLGGDLHLAYDQGTLETQIIAREVVDGYKRIRYGQEARYRYWDRTDLPNGEKLRPFLWSFLKIATRHGIYISMPFVCVLTLADDPAATVVETRALDERSLVHQISLASRWLKECLDNHAICLPEGKEIFDGPTRMINVGSSNGCSAPFLQTSNGDIHEWVALSHRWGNHQPLKTNMVNLATHGSALPWEALPRLFRDAILITRSMGYRYLWIDSLCIVQDSPDDWRREVSRMGNIYKYCVFMISAECCHNSSESIFERSLVGKSAGRIQQGCHSSQRNLRGTLSVCSSGVGMKPRYPSALQSRAWVLQEEILSPRTLRWSDDQLKWACRSTLRSEENPIGSPTTNVASLQPKDWWKLVCLSKESLRTILHSQPKFKLSDPLSLWYGIITDFCGRQITFKTDTFPAISGIAREIGKHTSDEYHAGIWKEDFHNGLLWSMICTNPNSSTSSAPSWSWAMLSNNSTTIKVFPAAFPPQHFRESCLKPIADLLAIDVKISGDDQFSQVRSGIIRLRAPYKKVNLFDSEKILLPDIEPFTRGYREEQPASYAIHHGTICCWLDHCKWGEESSLSAATRLREKSAIFVQIGQGHRSTGDFINHEESIISYFNKSLDGQIWALVLEPTGKAVNEYMRLGIARVSEVLAEGWETQVISII
jgi:hypothetical protein